MKATKILALLCAITIGAASCEQNDPYNTESQTSNQQGGGGATKSTENIIKENVTATVNYSQYSYWVNISTSLGNKLGTSDIKYGIECGYTGYNWQQYANGSGSSYSLRACVFIDANGSPYATQGFYWAAYLELQQKSNMRSDEKDLWNGIIQNFNKNENAAKNQYGGRVFVEVNGVRYYIKYFGNTFGNSSGSTGGDGGSGGGGSTTKQGVTDLYLYDYTEWPTKLKVIYKYESDVNVTSAKIYYGEYSASNSVSATVSSTTITATISGLKKNTVYYIKASATTSKGTVYSNESRIATAIE